MSIFRSKIRATLLCHLPCLDGHVVWNTQRIIGKRPAVHFDICSVNEPRQLFEMLIFGVTLPLTRFSVAGATSVFLFDFVVGGHFVGADVFDDGGS
jgi:hypothetical protein